MINKAERQKIIADFARQHGGAYDPAVFVRAVQKAGASHPAYSWFTWADDEAAEQHRLWQARVFAQGLVIKFTVQEIGQRGKMRVVHQEMPLILSPLEGRNKGGGYFLSNPTDPEHIAMLSREAAVSLQSWSVRYSAAMHAAGIPERTIISLIAALNRAGGEEEIAAE
jgi:hypothetical protein